MANPTLSEFFATETWWIETFLIITTDEVFRNMKTILTKVYETAPMISSTEYEEIMVEVSEEDKACIAKISRNI